MAESMTSFRVRLYDIDGFAYLWLLFVLALIAVGLLSAAEQELKSLRREREIELLFVGNQFRMALASYYSSQVGGESKQYPASVQDLLQDKRAAGVKHHLRRIYPDPMTGKPDWVFLKRNGRIVGLHSRSTLASIKRRGFAVDDRMLEGKESYNEWIFDYPPGAAENPAAAIVAGDASLAGSITKDIKDRRVGNLSMNAFDNR